MELEELYREQDQLKREEAEHQDTIAVLMKSLQKSSAAAGSVGSNGGSVQEVKDFFVGAAREVQPQEILNLGRNWK